VPNDILPGRDRLAILGNELASLSSSSQPAHESASSGTIASATADSTASQKEIGRHAFVVEHMPGAQVVGIQPYHFKKTSCDGDQDGNGKKRPKIHSGTQLAVTLLAAKSSNQNDTDGTEMTRKEKEEKSEEKKGTEGAAQVSVFDQVVSAAGYRPDTSICQELQVIDEMMKKIVPDQLIVYNEDKNNLCFRV